MSNFHTLLNLARLKAIWWYIITTSQFPFVCLLGSVLKYYLCSVAFGSFWSNKLSLFRSISRSKYSPNIPVHDQGSVLHWQLHKIIFPSLMPPQWWTEKQVLFHINLNICYHLKVPQFGKTDSTVAFLCCRQMAFSMWEFNLKSVLLMPG